MRSRALDPAVIVIVVLSLALGLQLAWTVTGLFGARDRGGLDGATSALPAPGLDPLDGIKAARFFGSAVGEPTAAASAAPPVSTQGLTNVIRWQAVMRTDRPSGIRVYPGANAQLFTQLGLRPGDLVLAINDSPLADQANSEQFIRSLSGTPQARLTIERNGQTESLTLDLTSVAGGAPQALQRPGLN